MARILINHYSAVPDKITGISAYTFSITEALVRHGRHEYVFITNWNPAGLPAAIAGLPCEIVGRTLPANETLALFAGARDLGRLRKAHGCDLIFHPQPTATAWGMRRGVVVVHDLYRVTDPALYSLAQRLQWHYFIARCFRRAGALIAVSDATRRAVIAAYPDTQGKIATVHEAPTVAPPAILPPRPIARPYALMVANLSPNKNVGVLIEALKQLADRGTRPAVCLVGRDEGGRLAQLLGGRSDIDLVRAEGLSDAELGAYYAHARVYVNTSLMEGFCLPVLEAHGFGVPVICSDLPVLREVAGAGALFVDPRDPAALADAITRLFDDAALHADLAARATANATRFSWQKAALETEAVFDTVLAAG